MVANVETMAYVGQKPWHGLGAEVPAGTSPQEIIRLANLDWRVDKKIITFAGNDAAMSPIEIPNRYALVRDKDQRVLDIVSDAYRPVQNATAIQFFSEFCDAGKMQMETAGSLDGGRFVFALAALKEGFTLVGGDRVEGYLLFSLPHKVNFSINVMLTPVRVVCQNTLRLALAGTENRFTLWHNQTWNSDDAKQTLSLASAQLGEFQALSGMLSSTRYNAGDLDAYVKELFPLTTAQADNDNDAFSRRAMEALALVENSPGANFAPGTWWNALNAVTYMTDHTMGRSQDSRLKQAWFGSTAIVKDKALRLAVSYAKAA